MELAMHAKAQNPDFKVIPQDAANLAFIDGNVNKGVLPGLISLVDGWGKESRFLPGTGPRRHDQRAYMELARGPDGHRDLDRELGRSAPGVLPPGRELGHHPVPPHRRDAGPAGSPASAGRRTATTSGSRTPRRSVSATGSTPPGTSTTCPTPRTTSTTSTAVPTTPGARGTTKRPPLWRRVNRQDEDHGLHGNGLLVPSPGGPYPPAGNATTVQNAIAQYGDEWDWWWRAAGLNVNAGRETWLTALRKSPTT